MHLQITFNQQSSISDLVITPDQLSLFRYNTFTTITLNHQINFQIAVEISHLLKDNGILNYNVDKSQNTITLLEACGLYQQGEGIFKKKNLEITRLITQEQSLKNSYGIYDYIEQRFINNPFKQIQTMQQEIIDENELLDDGIEVKKIESCASKPRACANCTCGRKEMEEQQDRDQLLNQLQSGTVQSSCGSCYLGDAFRCATCPYRGLPAFEEGEQVKVLQSDVLQDDIQKNEVNVDNGKVKLKI